MFELGMNDEQQAVVQLARGIALDVLSPSARDAEREGDVPGTVWETLFETGLTVPAAEAFGGGGIPDARTHVLAAEAFGYGDPSITMAALWAGAGAFLIGVCGDGAQQQAWLPMLVDSAERRAPVAMFEGYGRAPSESATTISRDGSSWRVQGTKLAVAAGATAEPIIVVGIDPGDSGRLRAAIVSRGAGVTATAGDQRIALDAAQLATVRIDTTVDDRALLGGVDADPDALARAIGRLRLFNAAAMLGAAQRSIDYASVYATERIAFGKPIAAFQGVSFMLADAAIRVGTARLEVNDAAALLDRGDGDCESVVTQAVSYAGVIATAATRDAVQVLGGHGFIKDHPVELWYRATMAMSALDFDPMVSAFEPAI